MMRLYHSPLSPFCRKVRLTLAEKRIEVELVEERYWERDPDFLRRSPAGKVPVLKTDAGFLTESGAICEWIEETHPEPTLMPSDATGRYEVRRLVQFFDDTFQNEVTARLVGERVNKKMTGRGYPDSGAVKAGARGDQGPSRHGGGAARCTALAGRGRDDVGRLRGGGAFLGARLHL